MKRSRSQRDKKAFSFSNIENVDIDTKFLQECDKEFYKNPANIISRNAIVSIGSMISTTNSTRLNDIDHVFMNTIKKKNLKATNQGRSGRCWMFSGLNIFRHSVIEALDLENFEFSETYLFFWDKLERSNTYLKWFILHPNVKPDEHEFKFIVDDFISDGGWWNMFSNLVSKYGLVPKTAMKETFQSDDSDDMNKILNNKIQSCANYFFNNKKLTQEEKNTERVKTLKEIYNVLVKFLGDPPKNGFRWSYVTEEDSNIITNLEPKKFMNTIIPDIDMNDFIVLTHLPGTLQEKKLYEVNYTSNVYEGKNFKFLNLSIEELSKYASKSVLAGMPVWFASDVSKDFNPYHSTLDDKLVNEELVFGENRAFTKGDRITFRNLSSNHAMTLIGLNIGSNNEPESWQVENSWGYFDNETPGEDGFLYMSHSWFTKNVMQIVVHKEFLSRTVKKLLNQKIEYIDPWNCVAPALKVKPFYAPMLYENMKLLKKKIKLN
jgi:bleomycin hydrolase